MARQESEPTRVEADQLAQFGLHLPGLRPRFRKRPSGEVVDDSNFYDKKIMDQLVSEVQSKPWLRDLFRQSIKGKRKGVIVAGVGGVIVTVGIIEFGHRGGRDLKTIARRVFHHEKTKDRTK